MIILVIFLMFSTQILTYCTFNHFSTKWVGKFAKITSYNALYTVNFGWFSTRNNRQYSRQLVEAVCFFSSETFSSLANSVQPPFTLCRFHGCIRTQCCIQSITLNRTMKQDISFNIHSFYKSNFVCRTCAGPILEELLKLRAAHLLPQVLRVLL